jgi:hypothetical protein
MHRSCITKKESAVTCFQMNFVLHIRLFSAHNLHSAVYILEKGKKNYMPPSHIVVLGACPWVGP